VYVEQNYIRACDVCSRRALYPSEVRIRDGFAECNLHWKFRTTSALDRHYASIRPFKLPPTKYKKGSASTPSYEFEEGEVLDLLCRAAPEETVNSDGVVTSETDHTLAPVTAGWVGVYLYNLIVEDRRPAAWITRAKSKLKELADYLVSQQAKVAAFTGTAYYGGFNCTTAGPDRPDSAVFGAESTYMGGLACLYAYRVHGTSSYLQAARDAATNLRLMQCPDKLATHYVKDAGGNRWHSGAWTSAYFDSGTVPQPFTFEVLDIAGLWFLKELKTTDGERTYGFTGYGGLADFNSDTAAPLSTMISEADAFWTNGVGGTVGFSASTPYNYYQHAINGVAGTASWQRYGSGENIILGSQYAVALWALNNYEGYSTRVAAIHSWLRSATSNSTYATPATYSAQQLADDNTGTYDPKFAIANHVDVNGPKNTALSVSSPSTYSLGTIGLLSAIQSSVSQSDFKAAKEAVHVVRRRTEDKTQVGARYDKLYLMSRCGLTYQTQDWANSASVKGIAQLALLYRQNPRTSAPIR